MLLIDISFLQHFQCQTNQYYNKYIHKCITCTTNQQFDKYQQVCVCNYNYNYDLTSKQCVQCQDTQTFAPGNLQTCYQLQNQPTQNINETSGCKSSENVILSPETNKIYCVTNTIKNHKISGKSFCETQQFFNEKFKICLQNESNQLKQICQSEMSSVACIQLQVDCIQKLSTASDVCGDILALNISNSNSFSPLLSYYENQTNFLNFQNFHEKINFLNKIQIFSTIFTDQGEIVYDGPVLQDFCQILMNQNSFDEQLLFKQANYEQSGRFEQFGVSQRYNQFQGIQRENLFNQNFTILQNAFQGKNSTQKCYFTSFDEKLYIGLYMINSDGDIQELYSNLTFGNQTLQQVKLIPITPDDYYLHELNIELVNRNNVYLGLKGITATYKKKNDIQQGALVTTGTILDPNILISDAKNSITFKLQIINKQTKVKIVFICLFTIFGIFISTVRCCNNSGSYQFGIASTKSLKIKEVDGEIQEIYTQNFWHFLKWCIDILSYVCLAYSFSAFIGSFQLYISNSKDNLTQKSLVSFSNSELIAMYIISTICFIYQKIYASNFKMFFYQTQWTDNISTNLQDSRLIYILNKFFDLEQQQPSNILFSFSLSIIFYYFYDEFYRSNNQSLGFDSIDKQYQATSFVFIFTICNLISYVLRYILQFIKSDKYKQFEQTLGSNNLSLIIQDSPYSFTVISQQPSQSADILEIAQEQQSRANYTVENKMPVAARYYLAQDQADVSADLLNEIQRLNAYCRFQIKNSNKKINGVKEKQIFDMIHFLPDIYQIADNTRVLASGQQLIQTDKLTSFMNLPWFIDLNIQNAQIYKVDTSQQDSGIFINQCNWKKWLQGDYWWTLSLSFITISIIFYMQVCQLGSISLVLVMIIYELILYISKIIMQQQLSYTNCVEKQWISK